METFWSKKVQSSELLYYSRVARFNEQNKQEWLDLLNIKNGDKVLEIGCGPGHFCNMLKKEYPDCSVFGIDLDEGHIDFAKNMCAQLKLDVNYQTADIAKLPFEDGSFDVVFSYTVVEHLPFDIFISEQKRILKPGGRIVILGTETYNKTHENDFDFLLAKKENLIKQLDLSTTDRAPVGQYASFPENIMKNLVRHGFNNCDFADKKIVFYNPDCQNAEIAKQQIHDNYVATNADDLFVLQNAKNGEQYKAELLEINKKRYEKRLVLFDAKERIFDYLSTNVFAVSTVLN